MSDFHGCFMSKKRTMFKFLASAGFLFMYVNMIRDDMRDLYIYIHIHLEMFMHTHLCLDTCMNLFIYTYIYMYQYIDVNRAKHVLLRRAQGLRN